MKLNAQLTVLSFQVAALQDSYYRMEVNWEVA